MTPEIKRIKFKRDEFFSGGKMIDYKALEAITAVIEDSSFERAAEKLNVSASAVSHRVKKFEDRLGTTLIVRGTPCVPTNAGQKLYRHVERIRLLEAGLSHDFPKLFEGVDAVGAARAKVVVNADSLSTWCMDAFSTFTASTGILLDISIEDQDFAMDWLKKGETDAAITATSEAATGCDVYPLGTLRYYATASPSFVDKYFPDGLTEESFVRAPSLIFSKKDSLQSRWCKKLFGKNIQHPNHLIPSSTAFVEACLLDLGWGMNPYHLVREHLSSGDLVELVPGETVDTPLFWQINRISQELLSKLTQAVVSSGKRALSTCLFWGSGSPSGQVSGTHLGGVISPQVE